MTALADMQVQLVELRRIRANGLRATEYAGRRIEYRSDEQLAAAIADLERRIEAAQGGAIHTVRIHSSKGFDR